MDTPVIHLSCVTHSVTDSHYDQITLDQLFSHRPPPTPRLDYQRSTPPPQPITLRCPTLLSMPGPVPDLLKSVPVSWARMRKERDWVVPVRGCQSSVSWISLFLLRSLGIKQGRFSTLRPCLHTHPAAAHGRRG